MYLRSQTKLLMINWRSWEVFSLFHRFFYHFEIISCSSRSFQWVFTRSEQYFFNENRDIFETPFLLILLSILRFFAYQTHSFLALIIQQMTLSSDFLNFFFTACGKMMIFYSISFFKRIQGQNRLFFNQQAARLKIRPAPS